MTKKAIRSIIFLMSVSLLGLVSFQAYWIIHSVQQETENFDRDIQQLIATVSDKISKQEVELLIEESQPVQKKKTVKDLKVIVAGSATKIDLDQIDDMDNETIIVQSDNGNTTTITTSISNGISTITADQITTRYEDRKVLLAKVVEDMAFQFAVDDINLSDRLQGISIDTLLREELIKFGFDGATYAYQLKDLQLDSVISKGGFLPQNQPLITYTTSLAEEGELEFSIQNKTLVILKSLWLTLTLSLILTLVLVSTFIYTINSILKQKRISNMKADFINNMTHEFKTPVATISLAVDSILHREVKSKPEEIERFGAIIKKENARMNQQIESLLDIALFDKGSFHLNEETVDVHELLNELKENFEIKALQQSGDIALLLNANASHIKADRMHFYNVLRNIIDNGIKFSEKAFRIKVNTATLKNHLIISITDQGVGMDKNTSSKIFDRFYRKTEGDIHTTKGFGLGLAYVKEVIDKMGAEITVESKMNKGTTFKIIVRLLS